MIVETIVTNGCTCHISDEVYKDKSQDEIQRIIRDFSDLIDFPKPYNHGVKVQYIYKNYRTNFRESQCIILPSFRQISGTNQGGNTPPLST